MRNNSVIAAVSKAVNQNLLMYVRKAKELIIPSKEEER